MTVYFTHTFSFVDANLYVHNALQIIHGIVLKVVSVAYPMDLHAHCQMQSLMEFYNVTGRPEDGDDPQSINILETEGIWDVAPPDVSTDQMNNQLKIRKVNIEIEENPKFANVGYY